MKEGQLGSGFMYKLPTNPQHQHTSLHYLKFHINALVPMNMITASDIKVISSYVVYSKSICT